MFSSPYSGDIPPPENVNPDTLANLGAMQGQFAEFQKKMTNSLSSIPGVAETIASQTNVGGGLPDYTQLLDQIGLTPDDMKKYTEKLIRGGGCGVGDYACQDKVRRAEATAEYTEAKMAFDTAKAMRDEKRKEFELVEYGGASGARKHRFAEGEREGEKIKKEKIENHRFMKNKTQNSIDLLSDQNIYEDHMDDLRDMLDTGAAGAKADIADMVNKSNVDNRKVYYEDQATKKYTWANYYLRYIYWAALVVLLCMEAYRWHQGKMRSSPYTAAGYVFFMALYPFLMGTVVDGAIYILKMLYGAAPRDVYMNP